MKTPGSPEDEVTFDGLLQEAINDSIEHPTCKDLGEGNESEADAKKAEKKQKSGKKVKKSPLKEQTEYIH